MERTGNNIGGEGARQRDQNDPEKSDRPRRQERLAEREIDEALGAEAEPQADGTPYGDDNVQSPEGVKPATRLRIEQSVEDEEE